MSYSAEVEDLLEEVEEKEKKDHEVQERILEKLTNFQIEDKRVNNNDENIHL